MTENFKEFIDAGDEMLKTGAYNDACMSYMKALDLNPRLPSAHYNIGAVMLLAKRPTDSLPCLLTALELRPRNAQYVIALARALIETGEQDRAGSLLAEASRVSPGNTELAEAADQHRVSAKAAKTLNGIRTRGSKEQGNTLLRQAVAAYGAGQMEKTFRLASKLVWLGPKTVIIWKLLSGAARKCATKEYAEICARRAVALAPQDAEAWSNLSRILRDAHRKVDAERLLRQAFIACGPSPKIAAALCELLFEDNRYEDALAVVADAEQKTAEPSAALLRLRAVAYNEMDEPEKAAETFRAALAIDPKNMELIASAAAFYDRDVDPTPMLELLEKARADGINFDRADLLDAEARVLLRSGELDAAHKSIARSLSLPGEKNQIRSRQFTLGRIEDKRHNYREAYEAFSTGNKLMEDLSEDHGPWDHSAAIGRITNLWERLKVEIESNKSAVEDPDAGPTNIAFLVGFPRSGTTLLDTILRSHSKVRILEEKPILMHSFRDAIQKAGEDNFYSKEWINKVHEKDAATLRAEYIKKMTHFAEEELSEDKVYIDKLPLNMNWAPMINRIFPRATFILALRHPLDSAISNLFQDFKPNNAMMNMTSIERINRLYNTCFSMWEDFEVWRKPSVEKVSYEDVVGDLESTVSRVMTRLGLEWEDAQSRYFETALARGRINTPSYTQVTQPIYSTSKERWRNYDFAFQGEDSAALREWAVKLGYTID